MAELKTKIGLEIHVQLKTKSKMFCRCNNEAFQAEPNTTVCQICLGMPGMLPVTNKQAVLWTIKTGLALNCEIPKIAKFDRKHYFYPDLPKGYQISQYDEPFCLGGYLEIGGNKIRLNRIHLEEDAGKLIHSNGKSLVDLNRAGTPLMEIVTEPDISSPKEAGEFLRKLQKIVRDEVSVSEASMEKGHMRCDANISVSEIESPNSASREASLDVEPKILRMSKIVELKNLNSFKFVEKALEIEQEKLRAEHPNWPEKLTKATHGYDSKRNETYVQRQKEEASDYRYFPEPDLPPFDSSEIDLEELKSGIGENEDTKIERLVSDGISKEDAKILIASSTKSDIYQEILKHFTDKSLVAKTIVHNYFGFQLMRDDLSKSASYAKTIEALSNGKIQKHNFAQIAAEIHNNGSNFEDAFSKFSGTGEKIDLDKIIEKIIAENPSEVSAYKAGKTQLLGFFMGRAMRETGGKLNPSEVNKILCDKLK